MSISSRSPIAIAALILVGSAIFSGTAQATLTDPFFNATAYDNYYTGISSGMFGADASAYTGFYLGDSLAYSKADLYEIAGDEKGSDFTQYTSFSGAYYTRIDESTTMDFSFTVDTDSELTWDYTQVSYYMDSILTIDGSSVDVTGLVFNQSGPDVSGSLLLAPGAHDVELDATSSNFGSYLFDQNSLHLTIASPYNTGPTPAPGAWAPVLASGLMTWCRRRKAFIRR